MLVCIHCLLIGSCRFSASLPNNNLLVSLHYSSNLNTYSHITSNHHSVTHSPLSCDIIDDCSETQLLSYTQSHKDASKQKVKAKVKIRAFQSSLAILVLVSRSCGRVRCVLIFLFFSLFPFFFSGLCYTLHFLSPDNLIYLETERRRTCPYYSRG